MAALASRVANRLGRFIDVWYTNDTQDVVMIGCGALGMVGGVGLTIKEADPKDEHMVARTVATSFGASVAGGAIGVMTGAFVHAVGPVVMPLSLAGCAYKKVTAYRDRARDLNVGR